MMSNDRKALKESFLWGVLASDWDLSKGCEISTPWPKESHIHITILVQELHSCKQGCEKVLQDCKTQGSHTRELNRFQNLSNSSTEGGHHYKVSVMAWRQSPKSTQSSIPTLPSPADTSACVGPTWASLRSRRRRVQATLPNLPNPSRFGQLRIQKTFPMGLLQILAARACLGEDHRR